MAKTILTILVSFMLFSDLFAHKTALPVPQNKIELSYVTNPEIGCGCSFARNKTDLRLRRYIYIQGIDDPAYININGKNLELQPVDSSELNGKVKVGTQAWETFTAGDLKIRLDTTVTWVCPPNDESCEVTYYKAKLTVNGKGQEIKEMLTGHCGC